ncbi:MAG: hypothetical protein DSZ28_03355 [Thiothrix sp.]|nr:MAG: hypothetical protein DSZ28_03355 [Thiothrix sp.]
MNNNSKNTLNSLKRVVGIITLGSFIYISAYGAYLLNRYAAPNQVYIFIGVSFVLTLLAGVSLFLYDKRIKSILGGSPDEIIEVLKSINPIEGITHSSAGIWNTEIFSTVLSIKNEIENFEMSNIEEFNEASRLRTALDSVTAQIMIADTDLNIIYINSSAKNMFIEAQEEIRKIIPQFDAASLLGMNIDQFHKNPNHQRGLLAGLKGTHVAQFDIGNATIGFTAHPLIDSSGENVGTVVEWKNKTQQIKIENEIHNIVNASLEGDLTKRINLDDKEGFYQNISYGVNDLLSVNQLVIDETSRVLKGLSEGDLSDEISFDYTGSYEELKNHANNSIKKLHHVLSNVKRSAEEVQSGAQEISQGNLNLSNRTENQAMSLEKTAAAMEQMTGTVRQNADNVLEADQLAASTRTQAENSGEIVENAISAMEEIKVASTKIANIIGVIDEIAFQTNLLALNAAVEAAHAGDQGRGFAVVASEVRNLAQRSAEAAKEIKGLIQDSVSKVDTGTDLVYQSGEALDKIVDSVKKVSNIISEISIANQEQSMGIEQVNQSVLKMDESTQQNAAMVEQVAAASESLGEQSNELNQMMSFFELASIISKQSYNDQDNRSSSRPWSENSSSNSPPKLNIASAKSKHLSWKTRIRSFLDGKESLTMEQAVSHRDCDLGKWIYSEGIKYLGSSEAFNQLEKCHAGLHADIKTIITLKEQGNNNKAEDHYRNIEAASGKVVGYLDIIEGEIKLNSGQKNTEIHRIPATNTVNSNQNRESF